MTYSAYGVSLTEGQKQSLATAVRAGRRFTLGLSLAQLTGPDQLMLTATQINKIQRARTSRHGADISLSKTQLTKLGGLGPFGASMLAGVAAPIVSKMLRFGQGQGMQLPGTRRGRGQGRVCNYLEQDADMVKDRVCNCLEQPEVAEKKDGGLPWRMLT